MTIPFVLIPAKVRTPSVLAEFDDSKAGVGTPARPNRLFLAGLLNAAKTANALTPKVVTRLQEVEDFVGRGSPLANMYAALIAITSKFEVTICGVDANPGGTAAAKQLTFTGPATAAGTIPLLAMGRPVDVPVAVGDTATVICAAAVAKLNAVTDLEFTAAVNGGDDTLADLTADHKGVHGNNYDIRLNLEPGQSLPAGVGVSGLGSFASGAGVIDMTTVFAVMPDRRYSHIVSQWTDSQALTDYKTEMESRWSPDRMLYGRVFAAVRGTHSANVAIADAKNTGKVIVASRPVCPSTPWETAARLAAVDIVRNAADPGRPRQRLLVPNERPAADDVRFNGDEIEAQIDSGLTPLAEDDFGDVRIVDLVTLYKTNAGGVVDEAQRSGTHMAIREALAWDFQVRMTLKFPDWKLAGGDEDFGEGAPVVTRNVALAEILDLGFNPTTGWHKQALIQNKAQFKADVQVEIALPDRVNFLIPATLIGQAKVFAALIQPRIQ